jgi:hypothetical protein
VRWCPWVLDGGAVVRHAGRFPAEQQNRKQACARERSCGSLGRWGRGQRRLLQFRLGNPPESALERPTRFPVACAGRESRSRGAERWLLCQDTESPECVVEGRGSGELPCRSGGAYTPRKRRTPTWRCRGTPASPDREDRRHVRHVHHNLLHRLRLRLHLRPRQLCDGTPLRHNADAVTVLQTELHTHGHTGGLAVCGTTTTRSPGSSSTPSSTTGTGLERQQCQRRAPSGPPGLPRGLRGRGDPFPVDGAAEVQVGGRVPLLRLRSTRHRTLRVARADPGIAYRTCAALQSRWTSHARHLERSGLGPNSPRLRLSTVAITTASAFVIECWSTLTSCRCAVPRS